MTLIQRVTRIGTTPEVTLPDAAKVLSGDPGLTTWRREEADGLDAGRMIGGIREDDDD